MSIDPAPVDSSPPWHDDSEKDIKGEHWDPTAQDAFGNEETAEVKYKVLEWWYVRLVPIQMVVEKTLTEPQAMWSTYASA